MFLHCKRSHAVLFSEVVALTSSVVTTGGEWEWVPTIEQLDKGMLMARDPILFYDEIPLYESELDDNGVSQLLVKVPSLSFALSQRALCILSCPS